MLHDNLLDRRRFLEFMGVGVIGLGALSKSALAGIDGEVLRSMPPSTADQLQLNSGLSYRILVTWDDLINQRGERFGINNDFTAVMPIQGQADEAILWVNHEYPLPIVMHDGKSLAERSRADIDRERQALGGSILKLRRSGVGSWAVDFNDPINCRISGESIIPIVALRPLYQSTTAVGTFANCSGGSTPWGSVLTCEENYQDYYGEVRFDAQIGERTHIPGSSFYGWDQYYPEPPEHYGWVNEIDLLKGTAKKLTALGRFCHEGATVTTARDGRAVCYMGDDSNNQFIYKFISSKPGSLDEGSLYVADIINGRWLPLDRERQPLLKARFRDHTELLVRTREAAALVGATPCDRPEGMAIDPKTGAIFVALTNNTERNNPCGSILKIVEAGGDYLSEDFLAATFLTGGKDFGFACPDNLCFDSKGDLWFATDISGSKIGQGPYQGLGNNVLCLVPMSGPQAGQVIRMAVAPIDAEFTGMSFTPDGSTMIVSVQHPGENSRSATAYTSSWPHGQRGLKPRSAVVAITPKQPNKTWF